MNAKPQPTQYNFSTIIPIRITDINYGNHLGNDSFLALIHEARVQYLNSVGLSELNFAGVGLIMRDVQIEFKSELFYGDKVKVEVAADHFSKASFDIYYRMLHSVTNSLVAHARTGMVCFNYSAKKVTAIPEEARAALLSIDKGK